MIDPQTEVLFPLAKAADHYPRRHGKKPSFCTVWRHAIKGSRGITLETIRLPVGLYTSREAVHRFFQALTASVEAFASALPASQPQTHRRPKARTAAQRQRDVSGAEQRMDAAGI